MDYSILAVVVVVFITGYNFYLSYKQARVHNQMEKLLIIAEDMRKTTIDILLEMKKR